MNSFMVQLNICSNPRIENYYMYRDKKANQKNIEKSRIKISWPMRPKWTPSSEMRSSSLVRSGCRMTPPPSLRKSLLARLCSRLLFLSSCLLFPCLHTLLGNMSDQ